MKRCPYCAEDIQEQAKVCKHCGRDLLPQSSTHSQLEAFEKFMVSYGSGWVLANKSTTTLSYQKVVQGSKGSCLVAVLLFCLAILPGILYLYFANKSSKTYQLTVSMDASGTLAPSGDSEGIRVYGVFLSKQKQQINTVIQVKT